MVIFCDIDGVIADCSHRLHYLEERDYDSFYSEKEMLNDKPIEAGIELVNSLQDYYLNEFYYLTGRPIRTFETTNKWLEKNNLLKAPIFMRKDHDYRKSSVVKVQELKKYFKHNIVESPILFIDDDPANVKAVIEVFPQIKGMIFGTRRLFEACLKK